MAQGRFSEAIRHHLGGDFVEETVEAANTLAGEEWRKNRGIRRFSGAIGAYSREMLDLGKIPIIIFDRANRAIRRRS